MSMSELWVETVPGKRSIAWCPRPQRAIVAAPVQTTNRGEDDNAVPATYTNREKTVGSRSCICGGQFGGNENGVSVSPNYRAASRLLKTPAQTTGRPAPRRG